MNLNSVGSSNFTIATTYNSMTYWGITDYQMTGGGGVNFAHIYGNTYRIAAVGHYCKRMVFTHEIGHGLGLGHNTSNSAVIMYPDGPHLCASGLYNPQIDDIAGINAHY